MIIRSLDENSKPKAPHGNGVYVLYGNNKILGGVFKTTAEAERFIELLLNDTNSSIYDDKNLYYVKVGNNDIIKMIGGDIIGGPFEEEQFAFEWLCMIINQIEKYFIEKDRQINHQNETKFEI